MSDHPRSTALVRTGCHRPSRVKYVSGSSTYTGVSQGATVRPVEALRARRGARREGEGGVQAGLHEAIAQSRVAGNSRGMSIFQKPGLQPRLPNYRSHITAPQPRESGSPPHPRPSPALIHIPTLHPVTAPPAPQDGYGLV